MGGVFVVLVSLLAGASAGEDNLLADTDAAGAEATAWFGRMDAELRSLNAASAAVTWRMSTRPDANTAEQGRHLAEERAAWRSRWCAQTPLVLPDRRRLSAAQRRQEYLLCRGPAFPPGLARELASLSGRLANIYSSSKVCRRHGEPCYSGEPDLERLARQSRDPAELLWAWQQWRRAVGPPSREPFALAVRLQNTAATGNGYSDMGQVWREELETPGLENVVEELYRQVEPLYVLLHAYVRHRLARYYGEQLVDPKGPMPAHLLGNMWAQSWDSLGDIVHPGGPLPDLTSALRRKNYSAWDVVRRAEDFYTSLGLDAMTPTFWSESFVGSPERGRNVTCHGTAANMYVPGDYRMLLCADVTAEDFYTIHHEMGHIEYYMSYSDQPVLFQDGANSAFQEAVGDAIMYGVLTPQHLQRLGIVDDDAAFSAEMNIALLLHRALANIPQLPFGLLVDKWRWGVFRGDVQPAEYNAAWWALRSRYQGVSPPVPRAADDFDPAAKFHIPDNTPYVRYFLAGFLQLQFFKAMCEAAVLGRTGDGASLPLPLHRCDIYGSKDAGKGLRAMMSLGSSRRWPEALEVLTGSRDYSAAPLLQYYAPLHEWLARQVREQGIPVGWD